jgi:hypothetical protein
MGVQGDWGLSFEGNDARKRKAVSMAFVMLGGVQATKLIFKDPG